jgi:hypothetical protein
MHLSIFDTFFDAASTNAQQDFFQNKSFPLSDPQNLENLAEVADWDGPTIGLLNFAGSTYFTNCTSNHYLFGYVGLNLQLNFWSCAFYPNLTRDFREFRLSTQNRTFCRPWGSSD